MSDPNDFDETDELLRKIVRLMEYWKLTLLYIAIVLTVWVFLIVTGNV